jgi:quercetin dioxygenase-like cupin family protein
VFVRAEDEVEPRQGELGEVRVVFAAETGSPHLEQRVVRVAPGQAQAQTATDRQEVLYTVSGRGALRLDSQEHLLEPGTAVLVAPGRAYTLVAEEGIKLVSVLAPGEGLAAASCLVGRFAEQPEERADENRSFRILIQSDVTVFVGLVKPSRAPDHSHPYDEVGYILEGEGLAHIGGRSTPIGPGSCFHLPPEEVHCIENAGPGVMRILGVFHPSGSPASRVYEQSV